MRTMLRSKVTLLFMTLGLLIAIPAIVFADNLQDSITTNQGKKSIATGTANSWTNDYWVQETGSGSDIGPGNCDISTGGSATYKLNVPSGVTAVSPDGTNPDGSPKLVFTACGTATTNTRPVTFSSNTPGVYNISASFVSGTGGVTDTFVETNADLELTVVAAPTVTATSPAADAEGVAVTDNVTATFDQGMDATTISASNFKLIKDGSSTALPAAVSYNATSRVATLNPTNNLDPGTKYNAVVVSGGVKTPVVTQSGVQVAGGYTLEQDKTWSFTTFNPNTAPVADGQSVSTNEDTPKTITLTGSDVDGNNLTFLKVSGQDPTNGTLGDIGSVTCTNTTPAPKKICSADVTYTPNPNFNGSDSFKFRVNDGTVNSATDATVSITVNAVNDAPSFTKGPNQTVLEDSGAKTVDPWATDISKGPADEASQTVSFVVTDNSNPSLFSAGPAVSNSGALSFTPAANTIGTATVSVKITDSGGTANGGVNESTVQTFTIDVNYKFDGFRQPVDNNGVYNTVKAGSAIPVKFSLFGNKGLNIFAPLPAPLTGVYPLATQVTCPKAMATDNVEEIVAASNSGLTYDSSIDQYNYVWKTTSAMATKCYRLDVKFIDGETKSAYFNFTK